MPSLIWILSGYHPISGLSSDRIIIRLTGQDNLSFAGLTVPPHCVHGPTQYTPKSKITKISTLSYTTKMGPINAALAALELQDPPNYTQTAKEFNTIRSTLSRRYWQITCARKDAIEIKSLLLIQQEKTLLRYINLLTKHSLPPIP